MCRRISLGWDTGNPGDLHLAANEDLHGIYRDVAMPGGPCGVISFGDTACYCDDYGDKDAATLHTNDEALAHYA